MRSIRNNPDVRDPFAFRKNTYRVLLTRGREGIVIFVPPSGDHMDDVANHLQACGAKTIEERMEPIVVSMEVGLFT
jgi:hypothetical protein